LKEKDLTLEAAKYMFNRLEDLGINAVMTRTDDEYLPKRDRINRILSLYNNDPNTLIISNHINAGGGDSHCVTNIKYNNKSLKIMRKEEMLWILVTLRKVIIYYLI